MRRLSELEQTEIWDRFESGESLRSISRQLGRPPSTIRTHVVSAGWKRPVPAGEWSPRRLSFEGHRRFLSGLAAATATGRRSQQTDRITDLNERATAEGPFAHRCLIDDVGVLRDGSVS